MCCAWVINHHHHHMVCMMVVVMYLSFPFLTSGWVDWGGIGTARPAGRMGSDVDLDLHWSICPFVGWGKEIIGNSGLSA